MSHHVLLRPTPLVFLVSFSPPPWAEPPGGGSFRAPRCSFSEGGLSESGKKRLCHGLATICSQRAGPNSWLHGGSGGVVSVNRFAALVSERLPVELQRLVAMALWKKGKVEVLVPECFGLRGVWGLWGCTTVLVTPLKLLPQSEARPLGTTDQWVNWMEGDSSSGCCGSA